MSLPNQVSTSVLTLPPLPQKTDEAAKHESITEPKALVRSQGQRKLAASDSGSDDASNKREEEKKWQPKSLRAPPTDDDPFGDKTRIPALDLSPLDEDFPTGTSAASTAVKAQHQNQAQQTVYLASPSIPYAISVVTQPPTNSQVQSALSSHQQQQQPYFYQSHPTIIVIPPTLADSLGHSMLQARDQQIEYTNTTMSRTTSTTMEPLPFSSVQREQGRSNQTESISVGGRRNQTESSLRAKSQISSSSSPSPAGAKKLKSTSEYNRTFREQRELLSSSSPSEAGGRGTRERRASDVSLDASRSGIESAKMHILSRPQLLLNVFTFWINLIACHGSVNHNQCVHAMLSDLRQHFLEMVDKKQRARRMTAAEEQRVDSARKCAQEVLDELRQNLQDRSFDTTRSIVSIVNCLGPYVLRHFLVKRGVVSLDPNANDTAVVWASLIASSDPTLPFEDARKITDPGVMLERMAWSKRVSIPGV